MYLSRKKTGDRFTLLPYRRHAQLAEKRCFHLASGGGAHRPLGGLTYAQVDYFRLPTIRSELRPGYAHPTRPRRLERTVRRGLSRSRHQATRSTTSVISSCWEAPAANACAAARIRRTHSRAGSP